MPQEKVKVIIEVCGGIVQAIYAGNEVQPMIDVVVIDHDAARVKAMPICPFSYINAQDYSDLDGGFPPLWYVK